MRAKCLLAVSRVTYAASQPRPAAAGVHRAETGGSHGGEDLRLVSDAVGHPVVAAQAAGVDELPGVGRI